MLKFTLRRFQKVNRNQFRSGPFSDSRVTSANVRRVMYLRAFYEQKPSAIKQQIDALFGYYQYRFAAPMAQTVIKNTKNVRESIINVILI